MRMRNERMRGGVTKMKSTWNGYEEIYNLTTEGKI